MHKNRKIRFYIDPETDLPHIFNHDVTEEEVLEVLRAPLEDRKGRDGSRVTLGQTSTGRFLKINSLVEPGGAFVVTAMELQRKPLLAFRRRRRRK